MDYSCFTKILRFNSRLALSTILPSIFLVCCVSSGRWSRNFATFRALRLEAHSFSNLSSKHPPPSCFHFYLLFFALVSSFKYLVLTFFLSALVYSTALLRFCCVAPPCTSVLFSNTSCLSHTDISYLSVFPNIVVTYFLNAICTMMKTMKLAFLVFNCYFLRCVNVSNKQHIIIIIITVYTFVSCHLKNIPCQSIH